ncbi:MAG: hypothetical protein IPJ94_27165 [Chloroflexi bacterium]|nr:hypothetical protein [Chloroflexota bacterium]
MRGGTAVDGPAQVDPPGKSEDEAGEFRQGEVGVGGDEDGDQDHEPPGQPDPVEGRWFEWAEEEEEKEEERETAVRRGT